MMKWTCEQIQSRFHAHLGADLEQEKTRELETHLRRCATCRETLELERELFQMAAAEPAGAHCPDLADAVLEAWETERRADRFARTRSRYGTALSGFAFRALIDPLLWADYQLRHALAEARLRVLTPLRAARLNLAAEAEKVGQAIASPLETAYRLVTRLHLTVGLEEIDKTVISPLETAYRLATRPLTGRVS